MEPAESPMSNVMDDHKTKQFLRHNFSDEELLDLSRELAQKQHTLQEARERKKAVTAAANQEIALAEAEISVLSGKVHSGYEHRSVWCRWQMDYPYRGKKTLIREDDGSTVRTADMNEEDRQEELALSAPEPEPPEPAAPRRRAKKQEQQEEPAHA